MTSKKTYKLFSMLAISILSFTALHAQHLPKLSLHEMNKNILNPAAMIEQDIQANLLYKNQWTGFENAPVNAGINLTNDFGGFAAGLIYLNDQAGVFQQNMIKIQYAYKLRLNQNIIMNFGLAAGINSYRINYQDLNLYHADEPILSTQNENSILPDFDLGILLTNMIPTRSYGASKLPDKAFWVGLSVQHLTGVVITNDFLRDNTYLLRHFNLAGGYKHPINKTFKLEENMLVKYAPDVPIQAEIGINGFYEDNYWAGLSFRSSADLILKLGITYQGIKFGYAYDFAISKIPNHSSHEIVLGYQFGQTSSVPKY
ncbi:MAG: PorP/SprF family type IX secretion system membrane protein [Bacteroidales bacterium]|jgi:type IX secretion system PorP/SprF family membrane protein|nr:PorP/SprF family type IX secretion system membrane protein [Bacteroidales bacterium]